MAQGTTLQGDPRDRGLRTEPETEPTLPPRRPIRRREQVGASTFTHDIDAHAVDQILRVYGLKQLRKDGATLTEEEMHRIEVIRKEDGGVVFRIDE